MNTTFNTTLNLVTQKANTSCEVNQYAIIEATQKLPKIALYLSIALFIILAINWLVLPFLRNKIDYEQWKEVTTGLAFVTSIWLPLILMYFTLDFNEASFKKLETILFIASGILAAITIYWNRYKIKEFIQKVNKGEE